MNSIVNERNVSLTSSQALTRTFRSEQLLHCSTGVLCPTKSDLKNSLASHGSHQQGVQLGTSHQTCGLDNQLAGLTMAESCHTSFSALSRTVPYARVCSMQALKPAPLCLSTTGFIGSRFRLNLATASAHDQIIQGDDLIAGKPSVKTTNALLATATRGKLPITT